MCGIAGIVDVSSAPSQADIDAMIEGIEYRGPDGHGTLCLDIDGVALGHRRLSILDLSDAGRQPMVSADGRYVIVYNGEIYNYLEMRSDLEALGRKFSSDTDTEVLLAAYAEWGSECLERCMGMYAFAIWDRREKSLFACRDRLGIKPFYYIETRGGIVFASEIKSILAVVGAVGAEASLIDAYMDFGYVPGTGTLHKGICRLPPAHTLSWRAGKTSVSRYWDLDFGTPSELPLAAHADALRRLLQESIALHLRSDVPLGVFLSGGLDSSSVVALLSEGVSRGLNTFSVAYDFGAQFDETPYARRVAAEFGTDHHEIRITPRQFVDFVPRFIWHMDEPVTEAAAISLYYVSKLAREKVVVCLSGEGSDELFAGYDFYKYNLAIERVQRLFPLGVFDTAHRLSSRFGRASKLTKYMNLASKPLERRYHGISSYESVKKELLYTRDFYRSSIDGSQACAAFLESLFARSKDWDPLSRMLYFDTKTWLVDDLLIKADRMSMATSIELRVPFLDHRVVEYAASIPSGHKIRNGDTKHVLKRSVGGLLPEQIVRRKKMGFPTPLEVMFRGELFDYAHDLLLSRRSVERGYFEREALQRLLTDHRSGRARNHREIWQAVVLEEWHRGFGY